jgi:hypothetical protein
MALLHYPCSVSETPYPTDELVSVIKTARKGIRFHVLILICLWLFINSAPVQTGPWAYPASCTMGTGSFPGVKRPGRGVDHPTPSSAEVKERVEQYLYSPSGPSWPVLGRTLPLPYLLILFLIVKF